MIVFFILSNNLFTIFIYICYVQFFDAVPAYYLPKTLGLLKIRFISVTVSINRQKTPINEFLEE